MYLVTVSHFIEASTKRHLYWETKNCNGNANELRKSILNIIRHYKVSFCIWYGSFYFACFATVGGSFKTATQSRSVNCLCPSKVPPHRSQVDVSVWEGFSWNHHAEHALLLCKCKILWIYNNTVLLLYHGYMFLHRAVIHTGWNPLTINN